MKQLSSLFYRKPQKKLSPGVKLILAWLALTILYSTLSLLYLHDRGAGSLEAHLAGLFGLFVTIGPWELLASLFSVTHQLSILLSIVLVAVAAIVLHKYAPRDERILLYILGSLLLVTIVVDTVRGMPFASFYIFAQGQLPQVLNTFPR